MRRVLPSPVPAAIAVSVAAISGFMLLSPAYLRETPPRSDLPVDKDARAAGSNGLRVVAAAPRSPASVGAGRDRRRLGVGLVRVTLE